MNYGEAVAYIEEIPKFTKKHTLEHTKEFLRRLGSPEQGQKVIHVAGTNGKGSVCAYLQSILLAEGKHVGFFTSPHLQVINERIRMDNQNIDDDTFLEVFQYVKQVTDEMEADGIAHPSYFEFLFGMGMTAFSRRKLDYVILETGLGGRLDATNAITHPILTIITSISLDHTQYLGDTIEAIAGEKAGILKEGAPVIYDGSDKKAGRVIADKARKLGIPCREITKHAFEIKEITDKDIAFSRVNAYDNSIPWKLHNSGIYQAMNASLAIEAMEYVLSGQSIDYPQWRDALAAVRWEGRMEEVLPGVYVDGAHNPGAIQAFVESVGWIRQQNGVSGTEDVVLFSVVADKEYEPMIAYLCQNFPARLYIVTEIKDARKVPAEELAAVFRKYTQAAVCACADIGEALHKALLEQQPGGKVYCLGSLYLVGMVKEQLNRRNN